MYNEHYIKKITKILFTFTLLFSAPVSAQFSEGIELNRRTENPQDMEVGDMDNDGWMDIVIFHSTQDKVGWFKNLGNGQYATQEYIGDIINAHGIELSDINQDGYLDVLAANSTDVVVFLNQGDGTFSAAVPLLSQLNFRFRMSDIDGDGDDDIFLASSNPNGIYLYENTGGNFTILDTIANALTSLKEFRLADLDGDNIKDLMVCSNFNNVVAWYKNLGGGSFGSQQIISNTQSAPNAMNFGDIDNDGDIDVLTGSENSQNILWYENDGTGSFGAAQIVSSASFGTKEICVADLDGDDFPEVISNSRIGSSVRISIYKYSAGSGFTYQSDVTDKFSGLRIIAEDMDNDGDKDIVSIDESVWRVTLNLNDGNGQFGADQYFSVHGRLSQGRFVDVDVDGDLDILAYNSERVFWLENLGNGNYGAIFHYLAAPFEDGFSASVRDVLMEDFNNDGIPDLILSGSVSGSSNPTVFFYPGLGDGTVGPYQSVTTDQEFAVELAAADFDNDGWLDLLVGSAHEVAWYRNMGHANFSSKQSLGAAIWGRSVFAADIDNDGLIDALYASEQDNAVYWCKNNGAGFGPAVLIASGNQSPNGIYVADLDGDNDNDLIVASRADNKISWYENLGNGNFGSENIVSDSMSGAFDVWAEDFDLDGDKDLVAVGINDKLSWFENLGGANFGPKQIISTLSIGDEGVNVGDYDNDGDMDILQVNFSYNSIRVLENFNISEMQIKGRLFVDENQNALYDTLEAVIPQLSIQTTPPAAYSYSYPDGRYFMLFNGQMGTYQIEAQIPLYWTTSTPSSYSVVVDTNFTSVDDLNFGFYPDTIVDTIEVAFVGGFPRCNDMVSYWLDIENIGTTSPSGIIDIQLDDSLTFVSASLAPDSITGQHLYWSYDSLDYFETMQIRLEVLMPDFNSMGDSILSSATVVSDTMGTMTFTTTDTLGQVVVCAYDPNDKTALPAGIGNEGYIWPAPHKIDYLIRFQNTGNDTAKTVVIRDQLDEYLEWNSLHPIAGSHPYRVERTLDGEVSFIFEDIMLPDSNVNEPASNGFILYSIGVKPNLPMGTVVENTAYIYFDMNPPVITNTKVHTFDTLTLTNSLAELDDFRNILIYPNPFDGSLTIRMEDMHSPYRVEVYDLAGRCRYRSLTTSEKQVQLDLQQLSKGLYLIEIKNEIGEVLLVRKVIRQ